MDLNVSYIIYTLYVLNISTYLDVKVLKFQVRSEGCEDKQRTGCGLAFIKIDGHDYSKHGRGYNFVVVDGWTGILFGDTNCPHHKWLPIKNYFMCI